MVRRMDFRWTAERDAEAIRVLTDESTIKKDRRYYHIHEKFDSIEVADVRRVRQKRDQGIMAVLKNFRSIMRDMHAASGHRDESARINIGELFQ